MIDTDKIKDYKALIGCDEVGRGPLAGPVVACAVRVDKKKIDKFLKHPFADSKKISKLKREKIITDLKINLIDNEVFKHDLFEYSISIINEKKIDKINILQASLQAMKMSCERLKQDHDLILVDGNQVFETDIECEAIIKGDSQSKVIALASIIAKNFRDKLMQDFHQLYPQYGFDKNAGYPTKSHQQAIQKYGITPIHRLSFRGVKEFQK